MVTISEIKTALHQQVANTENVETLEKVKTYFDALSARDKRIVAYSSCLKPLTVEEYKADLEEAMEQYRQGKVTSQDEFEKRP